MSLHRDGSRPSILADSAGGRVVMVLAAVGVLWLAVLWSIALP